jgi:hypothetical protein
MFNFELQATGRQGFAMPAVRYVMPNPPNYDMSITYTLIDAPAWLSLYTGTILEVSYPWEPGTYTFTMRATDTRTNISTTLNMRVFAYSVTVSSDSVSNIG